MTSEDIFKDISPRLREELEKTVNSQFNMYLEKIEQEFLPKINNAEGLLYSFTHLPPSKTNIHYKFAFEGVFGACGNWWPYYIYAIKKICQKNKLDFIDLDSIMHLADNTYVLGFKSWENCDILSSENIRHCLEEEIKKFESMEELFGGITPSVKRLLEGDFTEWEPLCFLVPEHHPQGTLSSKMKNLYKSKDFEIRERSILYFPKYDIEINTKYDLNYLFQMKYGTPYKNLPRFVSLNIEIEGGALKVRCDLKGAAFHV